jgi:hypothetical protein
MQSFGIWFGLGTVAKPGANFGTAGSRKMPLSDAQNFCGLC